MRLRVFQSGAGDCVLLTADSGENMLVDGGFRGTYKDHVRDTVSLNAGMNTLDLICVSHIDSDHISGILQLLDDSIEWRVFRHHQNSPSPTNVVQPNFPEPPPISEIWYNGFRDTVDEVTPIEDMLLFSMRSLGTVRELEPHAEHMQFLATGIKQGLELTARISPEQLGIELNRDFGGQLMITTEPAFTRSLGSMDLTLVGPFAEDLEELRGDWNDWVEDNRTTIEALHRKAEEDQARLQQEEGQSLIELLSRFAFSGQERGSVTVPNLASIVLLVEEGNNSILLTGDARDNEILDGLDVAGKLNAQGQLHVNALKLQHHGSINNVNREFCKAITADTYVVCGASGGNHENPDIPVLDFIVESRLGAAQHRSQHPSAANPFRIVFSTNEHDGTDSTNAHMTRVRAHVEAIANANPQHVSVQFLAQGDSFIDIDLQP